jgi:large conductance mechanosensitive channel
MSLVKEFRDFAMKGNVIDMAVGIIIGAAFSKIVTSLVNDIMMPLLGAVAGKGSFGTQFLWLGLGDKPASIEAAKSSGNPYIAWGPFVQATIDFLIVAFAIFLLVKGVNHARRVLAPEPAAVDAPPPAPAEDVVLLREIRDALVKR